MTIQKMAEKIAAVVDSQQRFLILKDGEIVGTNTIRWVQHGAVILYSDNDPFDMPAIKKALNKYIKAVSAA